MSWIDIARATGGIALSAGSHARLISVPRPRRAWSDDFYETAEVVLGGQPGEIVRAEPMDAYLIPGVRLRARAWRVLYRSTGADGGPTVVSGTLLLPATQRRGGRPPALVGYGIGTHGIADAAAPSRLLSTGREWEAALMAMVLARGHAVMVTDYQGLGTPGDHVYMVGRALGRNILDAMRAARRLVPEELPEDGPAGIIGYSEGGAAAAWAAQLQPTYAPELRLSGVAAGAAAADMEVAGPGVDGSFFSFFLAYGAIGYAAAYPELQLDQHLTPKAADWIQWLRESNVLQAIVRGPRFVKAAELTDPNVLELPAWRDRLAENRLGGIAPDAPMLLHHARGDRLISFGQSEQLRDDWQSLGADVKLHVTPGGFDHVSSGLYGGAVAIDWLSRRLADRPFGAPSSRPERSVSVAGSQVAIEPVRQAA